MELKKIVKSAKLNAPAAKVWDVLVNSEYNSQWYACFSAGTVAKTDWQVGSKVVFIDESKNGIMGIIAANEPNKLLDIEYTGFIIEGKEDYESEGAQGYKGTHEIYKLEENDGVTTLDVEFKTSEEYYNMMSTMWDNAMLKIKELAEN